MCVDTSVAYMVSKKDVGQFSGQFGWVFLGAGAFGSMKVQMPQARIDANAVSGGAFTGLQGQEVEWIAVSAQQPRSLPIL